MAPKMMRLFALVTLFVLCPAVQLSHQQAMAAKTRVGYANTVMANGRCVIDAEEGIPVVEPERENQHTIATAFNPNYGVHVMVIGRDSRIYHKHQTGPDPNSNWTAWKCLTPDFTKIPCSSAPNCGGYDTNPAMAWQPVNGTLVVFVRQMNDLDIHEFHLTDPKDPDSWSIIRSPACICNWPPCVGRPGVPDQTRCGASVLCDNTGPDCSLTPSDLRTFWNTSPPFPTSDMTLLAEGNLLSLYYRGFDGGYYKSQQLVGGDADGKWGHFVRLGGGYDDANAIIE
jgi:hypothetical protein